MKMAMLRFAAAFLVGRAIAAEVDDMGPAAFLWPEDRVWSASMDNTAPCGSDASVGKRASFPLNGGKVALLAQDDSYAIHLGISYKNDPRQETDFEILLNPAQIPELDPGHTCIDIPDPPSNIEAGANATLQMFYIADFDAPNNQTFFACADITYVRREDFRSNGLCFNATDGEAGINPNHPPITPETRSHRLSGGAIAGIVVGVVAALGLAAAGAFFFYRERQQKKSLLRQRESARGVKWTVDQAGKDSTSQGSVRLSNL